MSKEVVIEGERLVNATDYKAKSEAIIAELHEQLFKDFTQENTTNEIMDKYGNLMQYKKKYSKNDIMPIIQPIKVTMLFNKLLRKYKPMTESEAKTVEPEEYLEAFGYYSDIIAYINDYINFMPSKQTFSAFVNITSSTYNKLLTETRYAQVFGSIEDSMVDTNYYASQTGMVDSKTTLAKLETKDAGHNLVKSPDAVVFAPKVSFNTDELEKKLKHFDSMTRRIGDK